MIARPAHLLPPLQEPETIELGSSMTSAPRGRMHVQKDTFQYIPLEKGLRALLKNKNIRAEVRVMYHNYTPQK